ncbi:MAG: hypothetical protein KGJ02_05555 [Verrucomicrobiota bacterium]|nr:hypothetical protein [Verrucomicrobiota bacterium]
MNQKIFRLVCSAVALMGTSAFAQSKGNTNAQKPCPSNMQMDEGLSNQYSPAFNAPAAIGVDNGWDVFISGSFIYWNVGQQYMEVGRTAQYAGQAAGVASTPVPSISATLADPGTNYEPGFKVAAGIDLNYDGWTSQAEYTWLHQTTTSTFGSVPSSLTIGQTIYIPNDWFNTLSVTTRAQATQMTTSWTMNLDLVDWTGSRPFFQGRQVSLTPFGGLRGLWIRQKYNITATNVLNTGFAAATSNNRSQSWSVGPVAGMEGHWMVGYGFRVEGESALSVLYTRFVKIEHSENDQQTLTAAVGIPGNRNSYGCLRPTLDMGLGFGWGMYFMDRSYHIDLAARYDFMLLWDQNVMRQLTSALANNNVGYVDPSGDLYLHGLTFKARFDF